MDRNLQIGQALKKLRLSKNMRLIDVANDLNKTKSAISAYERGVVSLSLDTLIDLCQVYDKNILDFLSEFKFIQGEHDIKAKSLVLNFKGNGMIQKGTKV